MNQEDKRAYEYYWDVIVDMEAREDLTKQQRDYLAYAKDRLRQLKEKYSNNKLL